MRTRLAPALALLVTLLGLVVTVDAAPPLSAKEEKALEKRIEEGTKAGNWADVATAIVGRGLALVVDHDGVLVGVVDTADVTRASELAALADSPTGPPGAG